MLRHLTSMAPKEYIVTVGFTHTSRTYTGQIMSVPEGMTPEEAFALGAGDGSYLLEARLATEEEIWYHRMLQREEDIADGLVQEHIA